MPRTRFRLMLATSFVCFLPNCGFAQEQKARQEPPRLIIENQPGVVNFYQEFVGTPESLMVRAQAEYLRAYADSMVQLQVAERLRIENRIRRIEAIYEVRRLRWQNQEDAFQAKQRELDRGVEARKNTLERGSKVLEDLPIDPVVASKGKPLNDLLDRLGSISRGELQLASRPVPLPDSTLDHLRLWDGVGTNKAKFYFDEKGNPDYTFRPPMLFRTGEFSSVLEEYAASRQKLIEQVRTSKEVKNEDFEKSTELLKKLDLMLAEHIGPKDWTHNLDPRRIKFKECDGFLSEQMNQLGLLAVGKEPPPPFEGRTVQDLIMYVKDAGYRFAESDKGGENTYKAIADALRDVFKDVRAAEQREDAAK